MRQPHRDDTKAQRVRCIRDLMVADKWKRFPHSLQQREELAAVWEVAEATIRHYAAAAHNELSLDPDGIDQERASLVMRLRRISREARRAEKPDFKAAIQAEVDAAKFVGVEPVKRAEGGERAAPVIQIVVSADYAITPNGPDQPAGDAASPGVPSPPTE